MWGRTARCGVPAALMAPLSAMQIGSTCPYQLRDTGSAMGDLPARVGPTFRCCVGRTVRNSKSPEDNHARHNLPKYIAQLSRAALSDGSDCNIHHHSLDLCLRFFQIFHSNMLEHSDASKRYQRIPIDKAACSTGGSMQGQCGIIRTLSEIQAT